MRINSMKELEAMLSPDVEIVATPRTPPTPPADWSALTKKKKKKKSVLDGVGLEEKFLQLWKLMGGDTPMREYKFHPSRKWRFDFAWPEIRVAVEIMGGTYSGGAHTRGKGYTKDARKMNSAIRKGWRVFYLATDMIEANDVGPILSFVREQYDG